MASTLLTGTIPHTFSRLTRLKSLSVQTTGITGEHVLALSTHRLFTQGVLHMICIVRLLYTVQALTVESDSPQGLRRLPPGMFQV